MFTGIITGVGRITELHALGSSLNHGLRLSVSAPAGYLEQVVLGESIAINGACMTVTALDLNASGFCVDLSAESLARTTGLNERGRQVNLEKALRAIDRLGGHLVSGHVDGIAQVVRMQRIGESWELAVLAPHALAPYLAYKGSVAINGVSLTINRVSDSTSGCECSLNLIPHTVQSTTLGELTQGALVNLEIDTVARYVQRMLSVAGGLPGVPPIPEPPSSKP